jgi:hypothetical protein
MDLGGIGIDYGNDSFDYGNDSIDSNGNESDGISTSAFTNNDGNNEFKSILCELILIFIDFYLFYSDSRANHLPR